MHTAGPREPEALRNLAADCYVQHHKDKKKAATALKKLLRAGESVSKPADYCERWGLRRTAHNKVTDLPRSGRPTKITLPQAKAAVAALTEGRVLGGKEEPYTNWSHFTSTDPVASQILQKTGASRASLVRHCKALAPQLKVLHVDIKPFIRPKNKAARVDYCQQALKQPIKKLLGTTFIDAASFGPNQPAASTTILIDKASYKGPMTLGDNRMQQLKAHKLRINYYIAVNALVGPVDLCIVTGTTGHQPPYRKKGYMVSSSNSPAIGLASHHKPLLPLQHLAAGCLQHLPPCRTLVFVVQPGQAEPFPPYCSIYISIPLLLLLHLGPRPTSCHKVLLPINLYEQLVCIPAMLA